MRFYLPPEVKLVENHLTWMEEVVPYLERSVLDGAETMEEHLCALEKIRDHEDSNDGDLPVISDEKFEEGYNEHNPKYCTVYASRLNEATKFAYLSKFKEAMEQFGLLEKIYDKLEPCHVKAFKYAVEALQWAIQTLKNLKAEDNEDGIFLETVQDPAIFQSRWQELQQDDKAKAVLKYLWGCLGGTLKITEECLLPIYEEVLSLDPDYHIWYSLMYRTLRGIRRNSQRQQSGGQLNHPSDKEQSVCKEAFQRKPFIYLNIKDMAIMLKETLWGGSQEQWDSEESTYLQCKTLFEEALQIAYDKDQKKWTRKIQIHLAEFLLFGQGSRLDQDEGKRLFDQCLAENPENTTVLHKVGKLCQYGAALKRPDKQKKYRDWRIAEECYRSALISKAANYPCCKDYLKLLKCLQKYDEYVEVCDWVIGDMKRDYQVSDLKISRGCVIWMYNPFREQGNREIACESWLYVVRKLPAFTGNLYSAIREPPFWGRQRKSGFINIQQVISTLERMKNSCGTTELELAKFEAINVFLVGLRAIDPSN